MILKKFSASCNHSSSETTAKQKINILDKSSGANFPNPQMPVNNIYNFYAHPWPKKTILISGDSMINGIKEKCFSTNFKSVKVTCFSGAMIYGIYFNLIPWLMQKETI